ncbi:MAG: AAA family ATPase [Pseudomonadota bacterium]
MEGRIRRFFVLAGPPGAGKTTVLAELQSHVTCVSEPARRVLASERARGGQGTGDQDQALFVHLMLDMAVADYQQARGSTIFDRGIPDLLAFCHHYGFSKRRVLSEVRKRRYDPWVFWFPPWRAIYTKDDERLLEYRGAISFARRIKNAYASAGYRLITVPKATPKARASFILNRL